MKKISGLQNKQLWLFTFLFAVVGFVFLQLKFSPVAGTSSKFSLFNFFGPVTSGFLGTGFGMLAVFLMKLTHALVHGTSVWESGILLLSLPSMAAALYFGKKDARVLCVPVACFILFNTHAVGSQAWAYSLYWVVPVICHFFRERSLFMRSLGATFTAHAVGSVVWLYCFSLTPAQWLNLIPLVAYERVFFATGMAVTYTLLQKSFVWLRREKGINVPLFSVDRVEN